MRMLMVLLAVLGGGCSAYTEAQMRLVEQARRGVQLCRDAQRERSQLVERFHQLQREKLHEAFDEDVRQRPDLSAEWVIEHRRAYAAALDALARQHAASAEAEMVAAGNLDATEEALQRVLTLQSLQLRLSRWDGTAGARTARKESIE